MAEETPKKEIASPVSLIGVAWFRPEEWGELKRLCPDLQDTYEEWLANANAGIAALGSPLKEQVVKVILTVEELRKWKRSTGRKIDSKARANIAIRRAHKERGATH